MIRPTDRNSNILMSDTGIGFIGNDVCASSGEEGRVDKLCEEGYTVCRTIYLMRHIISLAVVPFIIGSS